MEGLAPLTPPGPPILGTASNHSAKDYGVDLYGLLAVMGFGFMASHEQGGQPWLKKIAVVLPSDNLT